MAKELNLHWHTVKELEKQYMATQLARAGTPAPKAIGIDEIAIRKGHTYPIVVSASHKWRMMWNLSNKIAVFGALSAVTVRNGFHVSMMAKSMPSLFLGTPRTMLTDFMHYEVMRSVRNPEVHIRIKDGKRYSVPQAILRLGPWRGVMRGRSA